jgi:hypothetical protein
MVPVRNVELALTVFGFPAYGLRLGAGFHHGIVSSGRAHLRSNSAMCLV